MSVEIERIESGFGRSFAAYSYPFHNRSQAIHLHDEFEIALVDGCDGVLYYGSDTMPFKTGDLFFFGPSQAHRFLADPSNETEGEPQAYVVQFRRDSLGDSFFGLPENRLIDAMLAQSDSGLIFPGFGNRQLSSLCTANGGARIVALLKLLNNLARLHHHNPSPIAVLPAGPERGSRDAQRVSAMMRFIHERYAGEADLTSAAEAMAMTPTSFCRFVKRSTGRTFSQHLNHYRLTLASLHLRKPEPSVSAVARGVGFESLSWFNHLFRERFGMVPSAYRRQFPSGSAPAIP